MVTITISKFKATCLALLDSVSKTGEPILVTRRGVPIAQVVPPPPAALAQGAFGCLEGTSEETGDVMEPLPPETWNALR